MLRRSRAANVETELSKLERIVTVVGLLVVGTTLAVIRQPASSSRTQCAILATKIAAPGAVNSPLTGLSAEQAQELAILKRRVVEQLLPALLMLLLRMVS